MAQRSKFIGAPSRNEFWAPQEASGATAGCDGEVLLQKSTFCHPLPQYRSCRSGTSFVRSDKGCKTLFRCKESESSFADATPQASSNQKLLPLIKISLNLWAQHFSSSALTVVECSTAQFTAHSTKETALFYNPIKLLNLSNSLVCTLTAVYSDSRDPLTKCFN